MSIHQTKTGQWFVAYREKGDRTVRRKYFSHGPDGKLEAKKWEAEHLDQARRSSIKDGQAAPITFYALAQRYLDQKPITKSSKLSIQYALNLYVMPLWGNLDVSLLNMSHLSALDAALMEAQLSVSTRNRYRAYCRAICQWGFDNDLAPQNPFAKFRADIKKEGKAPDLITEEELSALYQAAQPHLKWAIEVMLNTGVRPGRTELFALRISDVYFVQGGIWITRTKTNSDRTLLPLRPEFLAQIQELLIKEPGRRYLVEYECLPVTTLKTAWTSAKKNAGITRRLRLYDLRHLYATSLLSNGADLKAASEMLGHTSPTTTLNTYYHVLDRQKREALKHLKMPQINQSKD